MIKNNNVILKIDDSSIYVRERKYAVKSICSVEFPINIKYIEHEAFYCNKIENLTLPEELLEIDEKAFAYNYISSIKFNNKLKRIGSYAFFNNQLKYVELPDSLEYIGMECFDENVILKYKNHIYDREFFEKFGFDNIIRASKIFSIMPDFNLDKIDEFILDLLPKDIDSIKGYSTNYKEFDKLITKYNVEKKDKKSIEKYNSFFKLCYTMGLFNTGGSALKETIEAIEVLCNKYNLDDINQMFNQVFLIRYKPKFREIVICEIENDNLKDIIGILYNKFDIIKNSIIKNKEEKIGILTAKSKKDLSKKEELEEIRKLRKQINLDEVLNYVINYNYKIDDDCLEMKKIVNILSAYLNQVDFNHIQRMYKLSKYKEHDKYFTFFNGEKNNIKYSWISGDNPLNIILGYECDCCSKLHASGEDIMIQSMLNPNIKTLVLFDSNDRIIGKTTAYYNEKDRYMLFNNIEIRNGYNASFKELEVIIEAILKQKQLFELKGYEINDIRIGMKNNDLEQMIKNVFEIEMTKLLKNYNYINYEGDANNFQGQAIVKIK